MAEVMGVANAISHCEDSSRGICQYLRVISSKEIYLAFATSYSSSVTFPIGKLSASATYFSYVQSTHIRIEQSRFVTQTVGCANPLPTG